jgi:hypothetical protein
MPRHQQGVALFDVLIALLVIGVGISALSQLQGLTLLQGGHARARAMAAQLAREKLDDLRQFSQLQAGGAGQYGYDEIASNAGGRENGDGSLVFAAGETSLSDVSFQRSWIAVPYSWCTADAPPVTGVCSGNRRSAFVELAVTLAWTDADGTAGAVTIGTAIAAVDPALAGSALIRRPSLLPPLATPH